MLSENDSVDLRRAWELLEHPGWLVQLQSLLGQPIESILNRLPRFIRGAIRKSSETAIRRALEFAVSSLDNPRTRRLTGNSLHKWLATASGGVGGAFGLPALAIELPVTTVIILRSIADIAREQGEDLTSIEARLACIEVFAFGGRSESDNAAESGYFAIRTLLSREIGEAAQYIAQRGLSGKAGPALVRLISLLSSRFGVVVTEKAAATAVPIVGAAGGAAINALFMGHFQKTAWAHFTVRRLERQHGSEAIRELYSKQIL